MTRQRARTHRPGRPDVRQMMKLVVFGAVGSLCLAAMMLLAEVGAVGWPFEILMEAVVIPMVLALAAFPVLSRGPSYRLIRGLLMTSLAVILVVAIFSLTSSSRAAVTQHRASGSFTVGLLVLHRRGRNPLHDAPEAIVPRLSGLPTVAARPRRDDPGRPDAAWTAYRCLSCKGPFRETDGSWIPSHLTGRLRRRDSSSSRPCGLIRRSQGDLRQIPPPQCARTIAAYLAESPMNSSSLGLDFREVFPMLGTRMGLDQVHDRLASIDQLDNMRDQLPEPLEPCQSLILEFLAIQAKILDRCQACADCL